MLVKKKFEWTLECQEAFQKLKDTITSTPSLAMPTDTDPYQVETDGSGIGVGAILFQNTMEFGIPLCLSPDS